jgi:hypothetical protein
MEVNEILKPVDIQSKIYTIRGLQVMLDSDLAIFYHVETKYLNRAVKRNSDRFPVEFMFQITNEEWESLRFQFGTLNLRLQNGGLENGRGKHKKYLPYVFTEQGVAMLSAVLKSETAVKMSIQIINAFVAMRHFLTTNAVLFQRLDKIENKQFETDKKIEQVFNALEHKQLQPKQGIFFDGQIFDAYKFACDIVRKSEKSIVLIDNYIDDTVLDILLKRKENVDVVIYTKSVSRQLKLDLQKHNKQYPPIEIRIFDQSHDRFMIIDESEVYHIGASLKDLGKKWFAFSKIDIKALIILSKLSSS